MTVFQLGNHPAPSVGQEVYMIEFDNGGLKIRKLKVFEVRSNSLSCLDSERYQFTLYLDQEGENWFINKEEAIAYVKKRGGNFYGI